MRVNNENQENQLTEETVQEHNQQLSQQELEENIDSVSEESIYESKENNEEIIRPTGWLARTLLVNYHEPYRSVLEVLNSNNSTNDVDTDQMENEGTISNTVERTAVLCNFYTQRPTERERELSIKSTAHG